MNAGVYQPLNPGQVIDNLDVNENDNVTVDGMDYVENIEYEIYRYFDWDVTFEPAELKYLWRVHNPEGYTGSITTSSVNGPVYSYYRKDHLGNNREVWKASYTWGSAAHAAATSQRTQYYPSGLPWKYNTGDSPDTQPYKYGGKEFVEMHGLDEYDSDARWYYPAIMRTTTMDPLAEKYYDTSPYAWCGNNPVKFVDPDGRDWFYHSADGKADPTWIWHDGSTYNTGVKDSNEKDVILQGQEAVVVFDGSKDEKLGEGQNMNGKGAKLANVTVYGPDGKDDIQHYKGYTMSSDPTKFGVVADGDYTVNRLKPNERLGPYGSDLVVESRTAKIPEQDNFNPAYPNRNPAYLEGVFIHRPNNNGWAGWTYNKDGKLTAVSKGCLLIVPNQWNLFHSQLNGVNSFKLQLWRR